MLKLGDPSVRIYYTVLSGICIYLKISHNKTDKNRLTERGEQFNLENIVVVSDLTVPGKNVSWALQNT